MVFPAPETKRRQILEAIADLSTKTIDGNVPISEILKLVDSPRESIRTVLYDFKVLGWVDNPAWGRYRLTEEGKRRLDR